MIRREESRHDFAFLAGVVIGAVGGALATLVLAPMPGNEMQEKVRNQVGNLNMDDVRTRTLHSASAARNRVSSGISGATPAAQNMLNRTQATATDLVNRSPIPVQIKSNGVSMTVEESLEIADMDDAGEEVISEVSEQVTMIADAEADDAPVSETDEEKA